MKQLVIFLLLIGSFCSSAKAQRLTERKVKKIFGKSPIMQEQFVGFMLQEEGGKIVFAQHEDRYFVPASNTKLLTLYTALNVLGDSIPAFRYEIKEDSLIIWGTGDPSFLHPKLDNGKVYNFLSNNPYRIFLAEDRPLDFEPSYWRADLAHFPIYGNMASLSVSNRGELDIFPLGLRNFLAVDSTFQSDRFEIRRSKIGVGLTYPALPVPKDFKEHLPFPANLNTIQILLQDTLKKEVQLINRKKHEGLQTFYSIPSDSLFKHMMLPSDNFLAEQILLLCSSELSDTLEVKKSIEYSLANLLQELKNTPIWEDGSGLSRYNLFTPRSVLEVLIKLENQIGNTERLKMLLPAGGVSGTLRTAYQLDEGEPFVWAKTGSLRNMHLQSGWLETRKGKTYRFVFMNNNFVRPTAEIRNEMVRIMTEIHDRY